MACPNFLAAKSLCAALLTKFEKEDLAKVVNNNNSGSSFDCQFSYRSGYPYCPHYKEQQSKLK